MNLSLGILYIQTYYWQIQLPILCYLFSSILLLETGQWKQAWSYLYFIIFNIGAISVSIGALFVFVIDIFCNNNIVLMVISRIYQELSLTRLLWSTNIMQVDYFNVMVNNMQYKCNYEYNKTVRKQLNNEINSMIQTNNKGFTLCSI